MIEIISGNFYKKISDKLSTEIDISKLPLYGEKEIFKPNSGRYGKIKIKLEIENDLETLNSIESFNVALNPINTNYHTYKWDVDEKKLPKGFEQYVKPEIIKFIEIFTIFNKNNNDIFRFSVIDGSYRDTERPAHMLAVKYALIEIFNQI
jgi:hypothetical protein